MAKSFYSEVMGWSHVTQQMGDDSVTMLANNGIPRARPAQPRAGPTPESS
ncbi:MAG TPA: hypothetical protein QGF58_24415 [Myxococcota bacterium]|nr:hypothetical protein [Myxococcota bacterium]